MHETAILMQMDEPMASLSVMQSVELLNYIKRMRSEGRSILHLSRFADVCAVFERIAVMCGARKASPEQS